MNEKIMDYKVNLLLYRHWEHIGGGIWIMFDNSNPYGVFMKEVKKNEK